MAFFNWLGNASVHEPIYSIDHANIAKKLTGSNWRKKSIVRNGLYIWVVRGYHFNGDKRLYRYYVRIHREGKHKKFEKSFSKRDRALAYAKSLGSDDGEYPQECNSTSYITMYPDLGNGPMTIEVPIEKETSV